MKIQPIKLLIFKIGAIFIALVVLFLAVEIILKIFGPPYYQFNNWSAEYYTNPRGYHVPVRREGDRIVYGLYYRKSKERYRLPDVITESKTDKNDLILGLGDSFTYGRGVKYNDLYLTLLESMLNKNGSKIGIKNCARTNDDIEDIFDVYRYESSQKKYPLVIYGFVLNDFGLPRKLIVGSDFVDVNNNRTFNEMRKKSSLYNLICHIVDERRLHTVTLNAYLEAFKGENAEKKFGILRKLNQSIKADNSRLVIVLFPLLYDFKHYPFSGIHQKIAVFCKQEGIPLLDLLPAFSKYRAEDLWPNPIDHHPNEIAHRMAAEELDNFLVKNELLPK